MASPGQRRGSCGHVMAGFDLHKKCARFRDKKLGDDSCVQGKVCTLCDNLTDSQRNMLATPQYQIRKDKKSGLLLSPSNVTVVGPVDSSDEFTVPQDNAHAQVMAGSGSSPVPLAQQSTDFVSRQDFEVLNSQLEEKFARFEALLTRINIFSTPKLPVNVENPPVSDTPFINPSFDPRVTGSVGSPGQDTGNGTDRKDKGLGKSKHKKKSKPSATAGSVSQSSAYDTSAIKSDGSGPGPGSKPLDKSSFSTSVTSDKPVTAGSDRSSISGTGATASYTSASFSQLEPVLSDVEVDPIPDHSDKDSGEEGELSDSEVTKKNEEMNYRETVRAVRALLGWTHIPDFEPSVGDSDNRTDNPWKGKHPRRTGKVSIELLADDWLCYKMEKLNTRAAEGYLSRSQEAAGLKLDQFIRTPKSQAKWYTQSRVKQDGTQRPGKTIFGWSSSEARLNSQFSRIAKVSAYPASGPASRPVPQEILRRWEKCARESSLITNHAAGFNRCTSEVQEKMNQRISFSHKCVCCARHGLPTSG